MVKQSRFDSIKLGIILGLIVPAVAFLIFYQSNFSKVTFAYFITYSFQIAAFTKILSLCLLPNLLVFFLYIWKNYYLTSRGILTSTFIWTITAIILKFAVE